MCRWYRKCKKTYREKYIKCLKEDNIDFSQQFDVNFEDKFIDFNPFSYPEVI